MHLLAAVLVTLTATAGSIARLVNVPTPAPTELAGALESDDAVVRAVAARVAMVRDVKALVPALHEALAGEKDANAAREEVRALTLLGSDEEIAFVASRLPDFPSSIDSVFTVAVSRLGMPRALELSNRYVPSLRRAVLDFDLALWGHPDMLTSAASRVLGRGDDRSWRAILGSAERADSAITDGVLLAALGSESQSIRTATLRHLVRLYASPTAGLPESLREKVFADQPKDATDAVEDAFGRELLRRASGLDAVEKPEWTAWLKTQEARRSIETKALPLLTKSEQKAYGSGSEQPMRKPGEESRTTGITAPSFTLPLALPPGVGDQLLAASRCKGEWMGVPTVSADRSGRVVAVDVSSVSGDRGCVEMVTTLLRLSLADPTSFQTGTSARMLVVGSARDGICADERPVDEIPSNARRIGGEIEAPKVRKRVEPKFPESARAQMGPGASVIVILECVITRTGCVRDIRLLSQSSYGEVNAAAVRAVSKWKFDPGTLDGQPVDVIFNLTINFKTNR